MPPILPTQKYVHCQNLSCVTAMSWYANKSELRSLTLVSAVSSVLSIIGASYIIGRYWYARRLKAKSLSVYAASPHHLDVTKELIHIIAYLVLLVSCLSFDRDVH